ncbi:MULTISPECIES: hypothetical protein [unclassified Nodosilinea]|uniref:Efflux RND transporter permease subunit n=1 Tax=Leptolyngbya subtilissima DQ-A4 TaxID=2933933 RepID=A0ABV0K278_9CYAN|nr:MULTISPECIES: hypothetical protein [unclassified Nodosilinea]MBD2107504.1 hypothetical protein [Nodosilinea sp. FACHB-13]MBD2111354.1 hypothetical protein [Nodosilinea sp. FACHB-141]
MSFFRSYIAPLLIVLIFAVAMLAVSARIFLPSDMMAPAPIEEPISAMGLMPTAQADLMMPELSELIHGPQSMRVEG